MCDRVRTTSPAGRERFRSPTDLDFARRVVGPVAADQVLAVGVGRRRRERLGALVDRQLAARGEEAAVRAVARQRRPTRDAEHGPLAFEIGDGPQQTTRIGVAGVGEDRVPRTALDDPAGVHDRDVVGELGDDGEVVGDVQRRDAVLLAELAHGLQHARLGGDVESRRRLVADDHMRSVGERHRDRDALLLAAGQLMGIAVEELVLGDALRWQRHLSERLAHARVTLVFAHRRGVRLEHL